MATPPPRRAVPGLEGVDLSKVDTRGNWNRKFQVCIIRVGDALPDMLDSGIRMIGPILVLLYSGLLLLKSLILLQSRCVLKRNRWRWLGLCSLP